MRTMRVKMGTQLHNGDDLTDCLNYSQEGKCVLWTRGVRLEISSEYDHPDDDVTCYTVQWVSDVHCDDNSTMWPTDCFDLGSGHWYGGPAVFNQRWPMRGQYRMQPYVSNDFISTEGLYGSFVERYFLNSNGLAIVVDDESPLWVSIEDRLCIMAKYSDSEFPRRGRKKVSLKYNICTGKDVKTVHQFVMKRFFEKPSSTPDKRMFKYPVWSTWAQYKTNISQAAVLEFANGILQHGFEHSHLEIDDKWSTAIGDLTFDPTKFPDPAGMFEELRSLGFRTTVWSTPFIETHSEVMRKRVAVTILSKEEELLEAEIMGSRFIRDSSGNSPALTRWWNGHAGMWDFTNPEAAQWFVDRHEEMRNLYSIDSFKFDGGESQFLPKSRHTQVLLDNPGLYAKYYIESVAKFGGMVEVRTGYLTQRQPIFTRMMDKSSVWSFANGLKTMIPTCLLLGIVGYPFILPDMIGGNAYKDQIPDEELYIRWLQVNAFMPAMQFSIVPWRYESDRAVGITKKYINIHADYVAPLILKYAAIATEEDGAPIIRPLWWISPHDDTALSSEDEFLVGVEVLVAPVLEKGARKRDIYLAGDGDWQWRDERTNKIYHGGIWLKDYPVPLEEIPYFRAVKSGL